MTSTSVNWFEDLRRSRKLRQPMAPPARQTDFSHFVDRVFWALLTAAAIYCATQIKEMSANIGELNKNMALVIYQVTESQGHLNKIDARLDRLEGR